MIRHLSLVCMLVASTLAQGPPERIFIPNASGIGGTVSGPLQTVRNAKVASQDTGIAMDSTLQILTIDDLATLPVDTINNIPAENLAKLAPETLAVMPNNILAKLSADAHVKATITGEIVQHLPVDTLNHPNFPWEQVIVGIPPDSLNSYSPSLMGAIPWERVFPLVPMDTLAGMQLQSMMMIPPEAFALSTKEQVLAMNPAVLSRLPLSSLEAIPVEHLKSLPPEQLEGFSLDILKALDPELAEIGAGVPLAGDTHAEALGLAGPSRYRQRQFQQSRSAFQRRNFQRN